MYKACKELMKKNNQREEAILEENQEIYTNMIVYLRASDITEYQQERIREDIIDMVLGGQQRGDDIKKVMGGNYQEICDEIIEEVPKRTMKQKILNAMHLGMLCLWILGVIFVVQNIVMILTQEVKDYHITVTLGNLIGCIFIVIVSNGVFIYECKTAFKKKKEKNKILENLIIVGCLVVVFAGIGLTNIFITMPIIKVHVAIVAVVVAVILFLERFLATKDL